MNKGCLLLILIFALPTVIHGDAITNAPPATPAYNPLAEALSNACDHGNVNQASVLIDQGAAVDGRIGKTHYTPLIQASERNVELVRLLIAKGAKLDLTDDEGNTALTGAVFFNKVDCALALLDAGANPNLPNHGGRYPLMNAARNGNDVLIKALLAHHADINANSMETPAVWWAVYLHHLSSLKLLIDAGANLQLKPPVPPDAKSNQLEVQLSLLGVAAQTDDPEMIDLLLSHGADINGPGAGGETPLLTALRSCKPETCTHLLEKGADVNLPNDLGETPLMYACSYEDTPIQQALLDRGAKLGARDKTGATVLIRVCRHDYEKGIRLLVEHGADVNATDPNGETPLTYAGNRGDTAMVDLLRSKGAHRTDLHVIAQKAPQPALPASHSWALAVGAIYAQFAGENPQVLGYDDDDSLNEVRESLKKNWDATDRASFLHQIDDLCQSGYRQSFQNDGAKLAALTNDDFLKITEQSSDKTDTLTATRKSFIKWKDRSGLAWDLCRAVNLINTGYHAQYIDEQEAWDRLLPIARQIQKSFGSWQEMSDNFLDGREIWDGKRDPEFEACAQLLTAADRNSPWNQNSWKTDLSGN